ncbi:hypothetical protein Dsin_024900 [Dipteronia sinensis]|uniref:C2H2-type domain-containing protein n=1 Tax=Dipteronia sinensis TaxID=43782 RepID=A0AAE0DWC1_9ROSI|nr:hypothetical protein Dsin_024900 [Dipteronia sinensis]
MERTYRLMKSKNDVKSKWECDQKLSLEMEGDHSWPPKNYNCSFCKREFRSAQALGGHMNVHRRDRARLRHLASPLLQFPNPNPNSSSSSSSSFSSRPSFKFSPISPYARKSLVSTPLAAFSSPSSNQENKLLLECRRFGDMTKKKSMIRAEFGAVELEDHAQKCKFGVFDEKEKVVSLELGIGLKDPKEVLDLELRLG